MHSEKDIKSKSPFIRAMEIMTLLVFAFFGGYAYDINEYRNCQKENQVLENQRDSLEIYIFDITPAGK